MIMMTMGDEDTAHVGILGQDAPCGIKITYVNKEIIMANAIGQGIDNGINDLTDS